MRLQKNGLFNHSQDQNDMKYSSSEQKKEGVEGIHRRNRSVRNGHWRKFFPLKSPTTLNKAKILYSPKALQMMWIANAAATELMNALNTNKKIESIKHHLIYWRIEQIQSEPSLRPPFFKKNNNSIPSLRHKGNNQEIVVQDEGNNGKSYSREATNCSACEFDNIINRSFW